MSTHKYIDFLCVAVTLLALTVTVLFMNGEKLGLKPLTDEDTEKSMFSAADLNGEADFSGAASITFTPDGAEVTGNGAYFENGCLHIVYAGKYTLSGNLDNGSVVISADGDDKIYLLFNGVSVTNKNGAALRVEQADKVFITLAAGSENFISGGEDPENAAVDGAVYSRDDLTVNGNGSLTVEASYKHGIVCNDDLKITGGNIKITAPVDGIHANDSVRICAAEISIDAGDDGITASNDENTSFIYMESGKITVNSCYEGLEACTVTVNGGEITVYPTDDGLNANNGERRIEINGGDIKVINTTGRDADGFDSNGDIVINGGSVFISVPGTGTNNALDYGSERGGKCLINGGTVAAFGGSAMAEGVSADSAQGFLMKNIPSCPADTKVILTDADGKELISVEVPSDFSLLTLSVPGMKNGDLCTLVLGEDAEEITIDSTYDGGNQQGMHGDFGDFGDRGNKGDSPNGDMPSIPDGEPPEKPDGDMPSMPDGEPPEKPDGETPSMPDGEPPEKPDGETPSMPDSEPPEKPDGKPPEKPDGKPPEKPGEVVPEKAAVLSADTKPI